MRFHKLEEYLGQRMPPGADGWNVRDLIGSAQKFYIGEIDRLPNQHPFEAKEFPRAPYWLTAMESVDRAGRLYAYIVMDESVENPDATDATGVVISAFGQVSAEVWVFFGTAVVSREENRIVPYASLKGSPATPIELHNRLQRALPKLQEAEYAMREVKNCVADVAAFLRVINCVNVRTETVEAPAALNKKRARNGKPPIYSYKTLVLRPSAQQRMDKGGTHESPRIHLRRGHIKHRKTGDFWWQPHVVGDRTRGVVMKDYRADKLLAETT